MTGKLTRALNGVLNGPAAVKAMTTLQKWVKKGYVNSGSRLDTDFTQGVSALSYVGHWEYPTYRRALGDKLILIPMPKFGEKAVSGSGGWNLGISTNCKAPDKAVKVLAHFLSEQEVSRLVSVAGGAIPAINSLMSSSNEFGPGGPLHIYVDQINNGIALVRPKTRAYLLSLPHLPRQ